MAALVAIVVLGDEDLFCGFLEHFPSKQYALLCAGDVEEVQTFIEAGEPFLLVVNLDEVAPSLADTLRQARRGGAVVVGLTRGGKDPLHAALADWIVPRGEDVAALAAVLRDILAERRRSPRVALELPVRLKGAGEAVATTVSPTALFVLTERTLRAGATVPLTIEVDEGEELSCDATVVRVGRGESGRRGVVLGIPESAAAVRRLLQSLVERAAEVERGLRGRRAGDAPAGGDAAPPAPPAPDGAAALELSRPETTQVDLGAEVRGAAEAAIAAAAEADPRQVEADRVINQLKGEIWVLQDEATRHHARFTAAVAAAAHEGEEAEKALGVLESELGHLRHAVIPGSAARAARSGPAGTPAAAGAPRPAADATVEAGRDAKLRAAEAQIAALRGELSRLRESPAAPAAAPAAAPTPAAERLRPLQSRLRPPPAPAAPPEPVPAQVEPTPAVFPPASASPAATAPAAPPAASAAPAPPPASAPPAPAAPPPASAAPAPAAPPPTSAPPVATARIELPRRRSRTTLVLALAVPAALVAAAALAFVLWPAPRPAPAPAPAPRTAPELRAGAAPPATPPSQPAVATPPSAAIAGAPRDAAAPSVAASAPAAAAAATVAPAAARPLTAAEERAAQARARRHQRRAEAEQARQQRTAELDRARQLIDRNQHAAARALLTRLLQGGDEPRVRDLLASSHLRAGEAWAAIHHLEKAVRLAPTAARPARHHRIGSLYLTLGKVGPACQAFRAALQLQPGYKPAQQAAQTHCR